MTVFVSYTHDSMEHDARVLALAKELRHRGFDCDLDQFHANQSWPTWMENRIAWAEKVIVVCTETYLRRWQNNEKPGIGLGAQWESLLTRQWLYESPEVHNKFVPMVFDRSDLQYIPMPLRDVTRIVITDGYDGLVRRLLDIPPAEAPPVRTAVPQLSLAPDFFTAGAQEHTPHAGLHPEAEELISNLLPISTPEIIRTAKVVRKKKGGPFPAELERSWTQTGKTEPRPVGFWIDDGVLHTFEDLDGVVWRDLFRRGVLVAHTPIPTKTWSQSNSFADQGRFIKLLNKSLHQLCAESQTEATLGYSKQMKCWLFQAQAGRRIGHLKTRAIKLNASRMIYKAIKNKLSDDPEAIQHWQHEAFRYKFQRFGSAWYLVLTPYWAFTSDGVESPSRWQKKSSANMRKPEKNRAVLGHVLFWASVLCRDADLLRSAPKLQIHPPVRLGVTPSIRDVDWLKVAKEAERTELEADLAAEVLL
ncbi:hypothetical protein AW736_04105 [Termitidicoccus mucosus]|uniref:SEFIR domain-containing protein n=2 Tax=Termitidicoccus mucosus TaxID=1184151 RepID=A0A178INA9_9BACT|nr:hypothetical protein AW736_04105 [Opitutaceae bacterium TSB47]